MVEYLTPTMERDPVSGLEVRENWAAATVTQAPGAVVLTPQTDTKTADGVESMDSQGWTLYVPEGEAEPGVRDRIRMDGVVFAQVGVCVRQRNPFTGWAPYAQVKLIALEGR